MITMSFLFRCTHRIDVGFGGLALLAFGRLASAIVANENAILAVVIRTRRLAPRRVGEGERVRN